MLLVTGEADYYLVGETNAFLRDVLPIAVWYRFERTSHFGNIEKSLEFNKLLSSLIESAVQIRV